MKIRSIEQCAVLVSLSPADCLLLAEACHLAGQDRTQGQAHPFALAAAHLESLALIGAAQGYVADNTAFLAAWTLPNVRQAWPLATTNEQE